MNFNEIFMDSMENNAILPLFTIYFVLSKLVISCVQEIIYFIFQLNLLYHGLKLCPENI
jgi:hypothetical protein